MRVPRPLVALVTIVTLGISQQAFATERHAVALSQLAETVNERVAQQEADRAEIRAALAHPEVREIAVRLGINLDRVDAALNTLSQDALARAASAARQVNRSLVGGAETLAISATTIIVALLVVILIVVAVK